MQAEPFRLQVDFKAIKEENFTISIKSIIK